MALEVTLYTKDHCSLCEKLQDDLAWISREQPLRIVSHDIEADADLYERFRYLVPVVEIGGTLYYPPHDVMQLRHAVLNAAQPSTQSGTTSSSAAPSS